MTKKRIILWTTILVIIFSIIILNNYSLEKISTETSVHKSAYKNNYTDTMWPSLDNNLKYNSSSELKSIVDGYMYLMDDEGEEASKWLDTSIHPRDYIHREKQLQKYNLIIDTLVYEKDYDKAIKYIDKAFKYMNIYDFNSSPNLVWGTLSKLRYLPEGISTLRQYIDKILETKKLNIDSKVFFLRKMEVLCILEMDYVLAIEYIVNLLNLYDFNDELYYKGKALVDLSIVTQNLGSSDLSLEILNKVKPEKIKNTAQQIDLEIYKLINLAQNKKKLGKYDEALSDLLKVEPHFNIMPTSSRKETEFLIKVKEAEIYISIGNHNKAKEILSTICPKNINDNIYSYNTTYVDYVMAYGDLFILSDEYEKARNIYKYIIENNLIGTDYNDWIKTLTNLSMIERNLCNYQESDALKLKLKEIESQHKTFNVRMLYQYINNSEEAKQIRTANSKMKIKSNIYFLCLIISLFIIIKFLILPKWRLKVKRKIVLSNMERNNYFLVFQPIVNPKTKEISGVETLLRLKSKDTILTPNIFMKDIEKAELLEQIILWQLREIQRVYPEIQLLQNKASTFYVSINLSLNEIKNRDFIESLKEAAAELIKQGATICLEITENVGIVEEEIIRLHIDELINSGFKIAIDDFGIEYSNISMLDHFKFHTLKLDKYFIDNLKDSVVVKNIFKVVNEIGTELKITIVVEGVEQQWQKDILLIHSTCPFSIQGYYYSKPLEIHDLRNFKVI